MVDFLDRFSLRIVEICRYDIDSVRSVALKTCEKLMEKISLNGKCINIVSSCIFDGKPQNRISTMRILVAHTNERYANYCEAKTATISLSKLLRREKIPLLVSSFESLFKMNALLFILEQGFESWFRDSSDHIFSRVKDDDKFVYQSQENNFYDADFIREYDMNNHRQQLIEESMHSIHTNSQLLASWEDVAKLLLYDRFDAKDTNSVLNPCIPSNAVIEFSSIYLHYFATHISKRVSYLKLHITKPLVEEAR